MPSRSFDTDCVHRPSLKLPEATPPLAPPIFQASVFETPTIELAVRALAGEPDLYSYSRVGNPTVRAFEVTVASLEGAEDGVAAASGMGAIAGTLLGLLRRGDTLAASEGVYGATRELLDKYLAEFGVQVVPLGADGPSPGTRVAYTEAISNPLLEVSDIRALAVAAHAVGALLVVDATFATPFHCQPLRLGADLVVHSATKYLGGHSDLIAGVVCGTAETLAPIRAAVRTLGAPCAPLEAFLAMRGIATLHLRMQRSSANAASVARFLAEQAGVARVYYPGLAGHPTHAVASRVLRRGFGSMVAFDLASQGDRLAVDRFLGALTLVRFAASLADVGTTISHPATTSHRGLAPEAKARQGIAEETLRLSVGIEAPEDIIADLKAGLAAV